MIKSFTRDLLRSVSSQALQGTVAQLRANRRVDVDVHRAHLRGSGGQASLTGALEAHAVVAQCTRQRFGRHCDRPSRSPISRYTRKVCLTAEIKRKKGAGALVADSLSAERVDFWKTTPG